MTEFLIGQTYHGFTLKKIEEIADIHSQAYWFYHEKSGAQLYYLQNQDDNKVFNVAFKTPPTDDCGTPHILEHSVLCGSEKYEAKEPFNELAKGSLHTFLNAMTYADKTMYPIASCNEADFHHLMDVYLDAVFFPKIYEKKEIFRQEGWRYLLPQADAPLEVTGVVYNEMKGALSDPESLLGSAISRSIFGKTTYGFESGGLPSAIPQLTYEDFLEFHRKHYHPSNAYFYLYGDMEPMACLQHIEEAVLSRFTVSKALPKIEKTDCANRGRVIRETYPAADEGGGTYLTYNWKVGSCTDPERIMALQILSYVLLETNGSPLKTALLEAGICEETEGWFDSSTYEMVFSIVAKNADETKTDDFRRIIQSELTRLAEEGLPQELLQGALRKYEFLLREEDYGTTPKGLIYCSRLMKRWLHGENPAESLRLLSIMEALQKGRGEGYFEALIRQVFLENTEQTYVVFTPEKGKAQREAAAFAAALQQKKAAMGAEALEEIRLDAEALERFQTTEDTPEVLAQIPILKLSDIDTKPRPLPMEERTLAGETPLLYVPMESNGILYLKLHFDTASVPEELLPYTGLLTALMGKLDTAQYTYQTLPTAKNQVFGSFSLHNTVYTKDAEEYRSFVTIREKLLWEDLSAAMALTEEILFHTDFEKIDSIRKLVRSEKIRGENELLNQSHYFSIFYSAGNLFRGHYVEEITSGIRFYHFLCAVDAQLEKEPSAVIAKLRETAELLFTRENLEIALGAESAGEVEAAVAVLREKLPSRPKVQAGESHSLHPQRAAFTNAGGVLYNSASFDYRKQGISYQGTYPVLTTILNLQYLWNKIRVQGGAYGCGCKFARSGLGFFYSYRDPNLADTYAVYQNLAKEIAGFTADEREMTKYILGTINNLDQPKPYMDQLNEAISRYYKGISEEALVQERTEILHTTAADIRSCAKLLECLDDRNLCSIGNAEQIAHQKDFFDFTEALLK